MPANLAEICDRFSAALREFGYLDCPGNIMVSNPVWRQTAGDFGRMTRQWLLMPTPDSLMSLAIFLDAHAVCGDTSLLESVRLGVFSVVTDNVEDELELATPSDVALLTRHASNCKFCK